MNAALEKKQARSLKLAERKALAPEARKAADKAINAQVMALDFFKSCRLLASYVSDGSEPDLAEAMEAVLADGRRLCLPRFKDDGAYGFAEIRDLKRDLRVGKYGLKEPKPELPEPAQEDLAKALWLVPGVAFDER
jgi:5-formyltetrahydrofolate cyclo-ligase